MDELLRFAIAHKRLLEVRYKGADRLVEPHDYGVQKGQDHLPLIERCVVTGRRFNGSRGRPDQEHYTWDVLYARVN